MFKGGGGLKMLLFIFLRTRMFVLGSLELGLREAIAIVGVLVSKNM
jgi:hypothetical protein